MTSGEYRLYQLNQRAKESSRLPEVEIIDLREELKKAINLFSAAD